MDMYFNFLAITVNNSKLAKLIPANKGFLTKLLGTFVQKNGRTFTFGLTKGLGGSVDDGPRPNGGGGGAPPPKGGGGGIPIPGGGGGGITESGEDKAGGTPTAVTGGERGVSVWSAVREGFGGETEF